MKKRIFSFMAMVLFMVSLMSVSNSNELIESDPVHNYDGCYGYAWITEFYAVQLGFDSIRAHEMGDTAFQDCVDRVDREAAQYWNNN